MTPDEGLNHEWIQEALRKHRIGTGTGQRGTSPTRQSMESSGAPTSKCVVSKNFRNREPAGYEEEEFVVAATHRLTLS